MEKLFRYSIKGKSFKMFKAFFKDNFNQLSKQYKNYRALNAYVNYFDRNQQIKLMSDKSDQLKLTSEGINELIGSFKEKFVIYSLITPTMCYM